MSAFSPLNNSQGSFTLTALGAQKIKGINELFREMDVDGRDSIGLDHVMQVVQQSKSLNDRDQKKWVKKLEAQIEQARRFNQSSGSISSLRLQEGGIVNFSDQKGEPSLDPTAFRNLLMKLTEKDTAEEFEDFYHQFLKCIKETEAATNGSNLKRMIWQMFRLLDHNHDGYVDLEEITPLLKVQSKTDQKIVTRFHHFVQNKRFALSPDEEREVEARHDAKFFDPSEGEVLTVDDLGSPLINTSTFGKREDKDQSQLITLSDFQNLILSLFTSSTGSPLSPTSPATTEQIQTKRVKELLEDITKIKKEREAQYLQAFKVHDIMNEILEDVLKEEPLDVLAGIARSVERLQRTGKYPRQMVAWKSAPTTPK